jgi:hypothetical protein
MKYTKMVYATLEPVFLFFGTDAPPSSLAGDSAVCLVVRFRLTGVGVEGPAIASPLVVSVGTGSKLRGFIACGEELMQCQY